MALSYYRIISRLFCVGMLAACLLCISTAQSRPAANNSLSGRVKIIDYYGNELTDNSNIVIFIDGIIMNHETSNQKILPIISHRGKKFAPHILPIVKNTQVNFLNDDNIFHNVFSLSKDMPFDLGIYPKGTSKLLTFDQPGLIKIYCNIHPKMVGNILVLNNSLYAKTDADGAYTIENIPDGTLTVRYWHEYTNGFSQQISFNGGQAVSKNLSIKMTKKIRNHKNKFGKPYREKY